MLRFFNLLTKLADKDNNIYVSIVDNAHLEMAVNLYLTSFKRQSITNYLFMAVSVNCCDVLDARGINCFHFLSEPESGKDAGIARKESYFVKTRLRIPMLLNVMMLGFNPVIVDLDIVFIRDPSDILYKLGRKYDIVGLNDYNEQLNGGFYYCRATNKTISFYHRATNLTQSDAYRRKHDQHIINELWRSSKDINVHLLNLRSFSVAKLYWEDEDKIVFNYKHPWKSNASRPDLVMIHNMFLSTKQAKIYRFKESMMWMVDDNGYYSSTDRST